MSNNTIVEARKLERKKKRHSKLRQIRLDRQQYVMLLPAVLLTIFFAYVPMVGIIVAFQDFNIFDGYFGSKFVGLANFEKIFTQAKFTTAIWNTLLVSVMNLVIGFPAPIILALLLNELKNGPFKKVTQTISYLPHFLSMMAVIGIVHTLFGRDGFINDVRIALGASERITYLAEQKYFVWFLVGIVMWKETGWGTIIHLSSLSSISPDLYEAASIDGANRLQQTRYITLPHMLPTVVVLLIFQLGGLFRSNFELIYGLQNPYIDFEVISTIIYRTGIQGGDYSMSTALGVAEGLVALILVLSSNKIAKLISGNGIM